MVVKEISVSKIKKLNPNLDQTFFSESADKS